MDAHFLLLGVIWYIVFLFSTVCHESAHALAAKWGGDPTAWLGGQVTLNPLPHIRREIFGTVVVPIASYFLAHWMIGWASAPYDPAWQQQHPRRAGWMALAGPGANFALMILAGVGIRAGILLGAFHAPQSATFTAVTTANSPGIPEFAATLLSILFVLNLLLGTFNLIPVPPLDGSSGIAVLMGDAGAAKYHAMLRTYHFGTIGLVLAWLLYDKVFAFFFVLGLNMLYPGLHYGP
jgi:Zn-dependent protease